MLKGAAPAKIHHQDEVSTQIIKDTNDEKKEEDGDKKKELKGRL
jgi:hypothetical protein